MTVVSFGDAGEHAVVMYDRKTLECVIVANSMKHIQDALAVVNSIKTKHTYIIAPHGLREEIMSVTICGERELYEYVK